MESGHFVVITTCTNRKRIPVPQTLRASSLNKGRQHEVLTQWCTLLDEHPPVAEAASIYCGRSFKEALIARQEISSRLWIISAGLGLVSEETKIPSYSLTLNGASADSVSTKIDADEFRPSAWWKGLSRWREQTEPIARLILQSPNSVFLLALSRSYGKLIEEDLLSLSDQDLSRTRLFGLSLKEALDVRLQKSVLPYDERLDGLGGVMVGTRSDFAQRAIKHFTTIILKRAQKHDLDEHASLVRQALEGCRVRSVPQRKRLFDEEIIELITKHWQSGVHNSSRLLRILRDEEKVACEQSRFVGLLKIAKERVLS
jgi:hypothetical protein